MLEKIQEKIFYLALGKELLEFMPKTSPQKGKLLNKTVSKLNTSVP